MASPKRTLVLGAAASGKSAYAEVLVENTGKSKVYLASAQASDDEMRKKIEAHLNRRGPGWVTIEAPLEAAEALGNLTADQACLFDCATLWLSNHLLQDPDVEAAQSGLISAIRNCRADLVIVSNEVGAGIVPDNRLARRFREAQGRLNIALAQETDCVVQVIAGLPQILKNVP